MKFFPRRKYTAADGEYILHHVIEHLYNLSDESDKNGTAVIKCGPAIPCEYCLAIQTARRAMAQVQAVQS